MEITSDINVYHRANQPELRLHAEQGHCVAYRDPDTYDIDVGLIDHE